MLVFEERENPSTRIKTARSGVENQQTQPTYDAKSGNRTQASLVGGKCSLHHASSAPIKSTQRSVQMPNLQLLGRDQLTVPQQQLQMLRLLELNDQNIQIQFLPSIRVLSTTERLIGLRWLCVQEI